MRYVKMTARQGNPVTFCVLAYDQRHNDQGPISGCPTQNRLRQMVAILLRHNVSQFDLSVYVKGDGTFVLTTRISQTWPGRASYYWGLIDATDRMHRNRRRRKRNRRNRRHVLTA